MLKALDRGFGAAIVMVSLCVTGCPEDDEKKSTSNVADGGTMAGTGSMEVDAGESHDSGEADASGGGGGGAGDVFVCSNPATMYCQTSTVGKSGIDNREMSCKSAGGTGVDACPTEGCVGFCTTGYDGAVYESYAYSGTAADQKTGCEAQGGEFTEGC